MRRFYFLSFLALNSFFSFSQSKDMGNCQELAPQEEINLPNSSVNYPNNYICHVITYRKKRFWFGSKTDAATFTLVSPTVLIGAYHAIMQIGSKIKSIDIDVYTHEENGKEVILKKIPLNRKDFSLVKPFNKRGKENDCGLIILKSPITGLGNSFPKLITYNKAKTLSETFHLSGYPYEENNPEYNGSKLWERNINFDKTTLDNNTIFYPCVKSAVGDSGGPLWILSEKQAYLFATHVGGNENNYDNIWGESFDDEKLRILSSYIK